MAGTGPQPLGSGLAGLRVLSIRTPRTGGGGGQGPSPSLVLPGLRSLGKGERCLPEREQSSYPVYEEGSKLVPQTDSPGRVLGLLAPVELGSLHTHLAPIRHCRGAYVCSKALCPHQYSRDHSARPESWVGWGRVVQYMQSIWHTVRAPRCQLSPASVLGGETKPDNAQRTVPEELKATYRKTKISWRASSYQLNVNI